MWVSNGIRGECSLPACAGTAGGPVLVAGTGSPLFSDMGLARQYLAGAMCHVIAINDAVMHIPERVHHVCALDSFVLGPMTQIRRMRHRNGAPTTHTHGPGQADFVWHFTRCGGTSSMFAAQVALAMGFDPVIMCGVPLDNSGHYFSPWHGSSYADARAVWIAWEGFMEEDAGGRVMFMSGRSAERFGRYYGGQQDRYLQPRAVVSRRFHHHVPE